MLFPEFYLVICTSDLNSNLGYYLFSNLDIHLIIMMQIKFYKRPSPKILLQIWGSHKSDENYPKNKEICRSAEQSHPCLLQLNFRYFF